MRDFFAFRTMIAGSVIQVVFVLGLIGIVIGSIGAIANDQTVAGLLLFIFGALYWRILCELLIVVFRMNSSLNAIRQNTAGLAPASSIPASPVDARREEPELTPSTAHAVSGSGSDAPGRATAVTTVSETALPPAGWYDDSERPGHKRWWDGTAWGMRDDEHPSAH